jgi:hypothetical protein
LNRQRQKVLPEPLPGKLGGTDFVDKASRRRRKRVRQQPLDKRPPAADGLGGMQARDGQAGDPRKFGAR